MNVYDFDKTIYDGDSTFHFYFYCLKNHFSIIKYLPYQGYYFIKYALKLITKTNFKEHFYIFLKGIKDIDKEVLSFWKSHIKNIKPWYYEKKKESDVIISASPYFLLKPVSEKLSFYLIASRVDKKTGKTTGENCWGEEKVRRFKEVFKDEKIDLFFSDSYSDSPLANMARKAYLVKKNNLLNW